MSAEVQGSDIQGMMGFALPKDVIPDSERKGRLRANTATKNYADAAEVVDFKRCSLRDLNSGLYAPDLYRMGFDKVALSSNQKLMAILAKIKAQGALAAGDIGTMRKAISGSVFNLSNGKRIRMFYVAGEGILVRSSGPNGLAIQHDDTVPTHSKQAAAMMIHGDQDVYGFPLKRIMKGLAPYVFNHRSPDGNNTISPVSLVNFWIPLQQINMPLCLMDRSTLNRQEHQLRFEINVTDTLERNAEYGRNDIWAFLHDAGQRWYFSSEMDYQHAYIFDTLGMAHGAAILSGEKEAAHYFLRIQACLKALSERDYETLRQQASQPKQELPEQLTAPLLNAIREMEALLEQAAQEAGRIIENDQEWTEKASEILKRLTRKSIELRAVGVVY